MLVETTARIRSDDRRSATPGRQRRHGPRGPHRPSPPAPAHRRPAEVLPHGAAVVAVARRAAVVARGQRQEGRAASRRPAEGRAASRRHPKPPADAPQRPGTSDGPPGFDLLRTVSAPALVLALRSARPPPSLAPVLLTRRRFDRGAHAHVMRTVALRAAGPPSGVCRFVTRRHPRGTGRAVTPVHAPASPPTTQRPGAKPRARSLRRSPTI